MAPFKAWIQAFRLRTLPLALSCIGMGGFLAATKNQFDITIFGLCILTTILLQLLSNLANDYGDYANGADLAGRIGPTRAVQSGAIQPKQMKNAMILFSIFAFCSGLTLLYLSKALSSLNAFGFFLILGIGAIIASIKYTAGDNPYGYAGFGDLFVLIFFGWVGVFGSFYLQTGEINWTILLPSTSCGLLATGVLNINNIRDIESDERAGKKTIPVRIGKKLAIIYHVLLIFFALGLATFYVVLNYNSPYNFLYTLTIPLFIRNIVLVANVNANEMDPLLKQMAISTLIFSISFGLGLLF